MTVQRPAATRTPLDGVTVVELASNIAGPFVGLILRDLGARVIKIESPERGDDTRRWPPFRDADSAVFAAMNRGKESVAIDLGHPEGLAAVQLIMATADVFVQSLRPGTAERLGLGHEALRAVNPRLIYCSISGFGRVGPRADEAGFDAIIQAYSGLMQLTGHSDGPPARVGTGIIDFGTGLWATTGILAALHRRSIEGEGSLVEATLLGTSVGLMMHHLASVTMAGVVPRRAGTAQHNSAPYEALRAADGFVMVGVTNQSLWGRLCRAFDCRHLEADPRFATNGDRVANRHVLVGLLSEAIGQRSADETVAVLRAAGIPASPIRGIDALPDDPQVAALSLLQKTGSDAVLPVVPVAVNHSMADITAVEIPTLGGATTAVLREVGYDEATIAGLREKGVAR
jgi:crotonobetainyl-CoA:carnitine CoA-transferase CaiB-like acyl-CoA transferase